MNQPEMMAQTEYAVFTPPMSSGPGFPIQSTQASEPWTAL